MSPDMRPCGEVKSVSQKYISSIYLRFLRLTGVVHVELASETYCTRRGLRSSNPLRVVVIQTKDIFIRGCYL